MIPKKPDRLGLTGAYNSICENIKQPDRPGLTVIIDHLKNIDYPTFWYAHGYGLFSANPLGKKIICNGKTILNYA